MKKIDFDMFARDKKKSAGGGLISGHLKEIMTDNCALEEVISMVEPGILVWWLSKGDWSMHELLLELLNITGPAIVHISSYAMSETPARILAQLKDSGDIQRLYCVLDSRVDVRTAGSFQLMKSISDKLALVDTHAKVTTLQNDKWDIAVVGSANYTENSRWEAGVLTTQAPAVAMHVQWMQKVLNDGAD